MRCTKCGKITFDHLETCPYCSNSLKETRAELGDFSAPSEDLCWFQLPESRKDVFIQPPPVPDPIDRETAHDEAPQAPSLDSSVPIEESAPQEPEPVVELNPEDLQNIAQDESFKKALDELIPDDA